MTPPSKETAYAVRYVKHYRHGIRYTVDATVVRRMVQALAAIGHTRGRIAEETGLSKSFISDLWHGRHQRVRGDVVEKVTAAYGRLHMTPLDDEYARKVKAWARKKLWAAPLVWNDITDLNEVAYVMPSPSIDRREVARLRKEGKGVNVIAKAVGRSREEVQSWIASMEAAA